MLTSRHQSSPVVGRCKTRDAPGLVGRGPSSRKQGPLCAASFAPLPFLFFYFSFASFASFQRKFEMFEGFYGPAFHAEFGDTGGRRW